jgi:hypothetical protein
MKIGAPLGLVKNSEKSEVIPRQGSGPIPANSRDGVIILISQENRRAWQAIPQSLKEAKEVLQKIQGHLGKFPQETLAEIHQLDARCLVRLW